MKVVVHLLTDDPSDMIFAGRVLRLHFMSRSPWTACEYGEPATKEASSIRNKSGSYTVRVWDRS